MITVSGTLSKAWMAQALTVKFDRDYYFDPDRRFAIDTLCNEYAAQHFPGMRLFYSESNLGQIDYWDKNQVQIGGIQPNMILGMLLGADFIPQDDKDADITPRCAAGKAPRDLPSPESLLDHPLIRLLNEQMCVVQRDTYQRRRPIPPFFWDLSGRAAIHGVMTTAQKLMGETVFMDMLTSPQRCLETMHWIAQAYTVLCRHFSQVGQLPITGVHVGECAACMVSPDLIEQFVAPITSKIGEELGPIRLHSCGPGTNHLEAFARITNLRCLDVGGDTSIRKARQIFGREMLISIAPLPHDLSAPGTDPLLRWARRVLEENAAGDLEFTYHLEPGYNLSAVGALTDLVRSLPGTPNPMSAST